MATLAEIVAGMPQAGSTLQALFNNTKLGQQHFRPQDSMIGSAIAHPAEGINKGAEWLKQQMMLAANAPVNKPQFDEEAAWNAAKAGINIAGLTQTGAFPGAPSGPGVVGSIKRPMDIVLDPDNATLNRNNVVTPKAENIRKMWSNYFTKNYATDNDPIVKYIDNGGNIAGGVEPGDQTNIHISNWDNAITNPIANNIVRNLSSGEIGNVKDLIPGFKTVSSNETLAHVIQNIRENNLSPQNSKHVKSMAELAEALRNYAGTKQAATTPAGKYFEDIHDINASSYIFPRNSYGLPSEDLSEKQIDYLNKTPDARVFWSPYAKPVKNHMTDVLPGDASRMNLVDAVQHAVNHDRMAKEKALKTLETEEFKKSLATTQLVHKFDDGMSWHKLEDPVALEAEGKIQGHCVGTYTKKVADGSSEIYSLRNAEGKPQLTAEYDPRDNTWVQVKGRFNATPTENMKPYIKQLKSLKK